MGYPIPFRVVIKIYIRLDVRTMTDVAQCCRTLSNGLGKGSETATMAMSDGLVDDRVAHG